MEGKSHFRLTLPKRYFKILKKKYLKWLSGVMSLEATSACCFVDHKYTF